jgi:serine O-acetyltransferase
MNALTRQGLGPLRDDVERRCRRHAPGGRVARWRFFLAEPQYRTLFWWRLAAAGVAASGLCRRFYLRSSRRSGLEINTASLGGGAIIPHWGRILLNAESIGRDLYVLHNVTLGHDYTSGRPVLGDDVFLGTGATVLGAVTIGDHVLVAAGSVIVADVPSCSLVAGNPARVVREIGRDHISRMIGY